MTLIGTPAHRPTGFTLIEMLVTLAIVGMLAITSTPLIEVTARRQKEADLREALRVIRGGLDAYKAAVDTGMLPKVAGESGYPPTLDTLTESLQRADSSDSTSANAGSRIVILRRLPRDPFAADPLTPAAETWNTRSYGSRSDDPQPGADVFDVSSKSSQAALDGTTYTSW
jgi:general secretion pathway protein G